MRSQLTDANISNISDGNWVAEYVFNDNGDMASRTIQSASGTFTYDGHQLTGSTGDESFTLDYDENGNMTENASAKDLEYNWDNKLRCAKDGGNTLLALRYDPAGNRIYKETNNGSTQRKYIVDIVGDLPTVLLEIDDSNDDIKKTYIYANSQIIAQHNGSYSSPRFFYLHDRLGSARQVINTDAAVVMMFTFSPFGETIESGGTLINPFKFSGQFFDDEIGQYHLRARQYDPYISRFTSRDPVLGKFEEPLTLHRYLYCGNDPLNWIDPFGKDYVDLNFSWCYGVARGAILGARFGHWAGALAGAVAGTFTGTGGFMMDLGQGRNVYPYFGLGLTGILGGGLTTTLTHSFQDVKPGWYTAITVTGGHLAVQWGWDTDWTYSMLGGTLNPKYLDFEEHGITTSAELSVSVTRFYVFDKMFSFDNLLDQAVMLGDMFGSGNMGFIGLNYRNVAMAAMLDNQFSDMYSYSFPSE